MKKSSHSTNEKLHKNNRKKNKREQGGQRDNTQEVVTQNENELKRSSLLSWALCGLVRLVERMVGIQVRDR